MDLTLFACPKPFTGHIGVIQRNAITSWTRLEPRPKILLFGDEPGTAEIARALQVEHVPNIERTAVGTPRLDGLFRMAKSHVKTAWTALINADILLLSDFPKAMALLEHELLRLHLPRALVSSQRVDIDLQDTIDFSAPDWEQRLRKVVESSGVRMNSDAMDLFLFNHDLYQDIPPLALGRTAWDNYLVWKAREARSSIIDAAENFLLVHQSHDYAHAGGWQNIWKGEEARENQALTQGCRMTLAEARTHILTKTGLRCGTMDDQFEHGALAVQRIRAGLRALEGGNANGARDYFEDAIQWIESLQRIKNRLERKRLSNRFKSGWLRVRTLLSGE